MAGKARQLQLPSANDDGEPARNMPVPGYWRKVLSGAWDKTCRPLDWNAEKAAVVLVAVGTIILAGVHLGPGAMFASAIGYLWILAPIAFAALVLFIWGACKRQRSCTQNSTLQPGPRLRNLRPLWRGYQNPRDDVDRLTHFSRLSRKATVSHQYLAGRFPTAPGRMKPKAARQLDAFASFQDRAPVGSARDPGQHGPRHRRGPVKSSVRLLNCLPVLSAEALLVAVAIQISAK